MLISAILFYRKGPTCHCEIQFIFFTKTIHYSSCTDLVSNFCHYFSSSLVYCIFFDHPWSCIIPHCTLVNVRFILVAIGFSISVALEGIGVTVSFYCGLYFFFVFILHQLLLFLDLKMRLKHVWFMQRIDKILNNVCQSIFG